MGKLITASIDVMKIDKSRLITGKKGTYLNLAIWLNDKLDQFGNDVSIEQKTDKGQTKIYLGNGKTYKKKEETIEAKDEYQGSANKEAIVNKSKEQSGAMSDINDLPGAVGDNLPF